MSRVHPTFDVKPNVPNRRFKNSSKIRVIRLKRRSFLLTFLEAADASENQSRVCRFEDRFSVRSENDSKRFSSKETTLTVPKVIFVGFSPTNKSIYSFVQR